MGNAANTLFVSTADFIVNHALAKIKDFEVVLDEDEDEKASIVEDDIDDDEEDDSVYSQEMDSDEERPISVSKNINNNTNHPILEEEDSGEDESESEPIQKPANRRLACSFVTKHEDINDESEDSEDGINEEDEYEEEEANEDEMIFEFETPSGKNDEDQEVQEEHEEEPDAEGQIKLSLEDIVKNLDSFVFLE